MKIMPRRIRLLESLHLYGLDHLDPVILAALADEQPLLLIGPHGTAKSALLNRVAEALRIEHRHYNTSLISFDDLVGFPLPTTDRSALEYVRTPNDLWSAESVFLDEITRCRPEHQNKLFSIILERRVQGIRLDKLRYRWSAMNPVSNDDESEGEAEVYAGCFTLDLALADRFAYQVAVPAFHELALEAQHQVVQAGDQPVDAERVDLPALIQRTQDVRFRFHDEQERWVARYVVALAGSLRRTKLNISGRRAALLASNIRSIHAACQALQEPISLEDAGLLALRWGLPQQASGVALSESRLMATHRLTLEMVAEGDVRPMAALLRENDPVKRVAMALAFVPGRLNRMELSQIVADAFAGLTVPERYIFARHVLPRVAAADCLTAATYEIIAQPSLKTLGFTSGHEFEFCPADVGNGRKNLNRLSTWHRIQSTVKQLRENNHPRAAELGNIVYVLFAVEKVTFDPEELVTKEQAWYELFNPPGNDSE